MSHQHTYVSSVFDLVFMGSSKPEPVYDPDCEDVDFQVDPEIAFSLHANEIPLDKKREVVEYWKDCKKGLRKFESAKSRYRLPSGYLDV